MPSSLPVLPVLVEEAARSFRDRIHASFDAACRVQEELRDDSLRIRQVKALLMGRDTWQQGVITSDAGDVIFYLVSLTRYSPCGQSVHEHPELRILPRDVASSYKFSSFFGCTFTG
jgi:hypothetical protein